MRAPLVAAALAFALTIGYAAWLQPDWEPQLNDQAQYLALARGLVERGEFTRAHDEPFIPETQRLPGYPLLLAPLCVGGCDHWRIAVAQGALFAVLVLLVASLARRIVPARATAAAFAVALYLPFAYHGALALSDLAGAVVFSAGVVAWVRAVEARSAGWAVAAGALLGWAALIRASLVLVPLALGAFALARDRRAAGIALACVAAAALVVAPYVAYSERAFARPFGGNGGTVLWIGVFQGRSEADLDDVERAAVDDARRDVAAFDAIADRRERALAWPHLDDSLGARARALIAHDPAGWMLRAVPRSLELWAGDVAVRGGGDGTARTLFAVAELVLVAGGVVGALRLLARGVPSSLVALVIGYVWLTAVPYHTEGRYALPAIPFVVIGALAALEGRAWKR